MELSTIVSWIGTIVGFILNLTPITMFYNIYLEKESIEIVPESMLIFNILCPSLWACYWWLQVGRIVPFISAIFGVMLSEIFALFYLFYYAEKNIKKYLIYAFIEINLVLEFNYIFLCIISDYSVIGTIAVVINIINYIAPGQNLVKVIMERNYKLIPITTTLVGVSCSLSWLSFGIIIRDIKTIIPNTLGLIFSTMNSIIWVFFYCSRDKNEDENEEMSGPEDEEV